MSTTTMHSTTTDTTGRRSSGLRPASLIATTGVAAAALAASGVFQASDLHWGKKLLVTTWQQHLTMTLTAIALVATIPLVMGIARRTGGLAVKAAFGFAAGQVVIAAITTVSNINGSDPSWFNGAAALGLLLWLPSLVVLAAVAARRHVLSVGASVTAVVTFFGSIPLATKGGGILAAACWIVVAVAAHRRSVA